MARLKRREFLKYSLGGLAGVAVGSQLPLSSFFAGQAQAQSNVISLSMVTDNVEMVDTSPVPHWLYALDGVPSQPGPVIFALATETFTIAVTNNINDGRRRRFAIVGNAGGNPYALIKQSRNIPFGGTGSVSVNAGELAPGTYLYKDPTLDPVSRVLGLHGVLVILPSLTATNPYGSSSLPRVTALFNALGQGDPYDPEAIYPGQPWFATTDANPAYDPVNGTDSDFEHHEVFAVNPRGPRSPVLERFLYRTRIWVHSSIDPELNRAVITQGVAVDPATVRNNFLPRYFSLNGRQGGFAAHSPDVTIVGTVGEPHLIRQVNAGLATHSPHLHANHFIVTAVNNRVGSGGVYFGLPEGADNLVFLDTMTIGPEDRVDWLVPLIRPPDIPRVLTDGSIHRPGDPVPPGAQLVPLSQLIPEELNLVLIVPQNPLTYPMHSHMELDQTAAGGNYPQGAVTQFEIIGEFGELF
ncbi:MAG: hypothetical protein K6T55_10625 [Syntrophobacterales bacterium]|nr:hypothetical protein [Syntrophobacterales bacterium]